MNDKNLSKTVYKVCLKINFCNRIGGVMVRMFASSIMLLKINENVLSPITSTKIVEWTRYHCFSLVSQRIMRSPNSMVFWLN